MPTFFLAGTANYLQKTLNGSISDTVTTITLNNTTSMPGTGYIVIDRINSSSVATPNSREVVSYTGISGNDLTGCTRGADGSTARSHNDAAIVEITPTIGMWNNLATIVSTGFTSDGYLRPLASPASLAILTTGTMFNTSGASLVGVFPSAASGAVLTSRGNTLTPVYNLGGLNTKLITATRDLTAAAGDVAYTGVGFQPTAVIAFAGNLSSVVASWGLADSAGGEYSLYSTYTPVYQTSTSLLIALNTSAGVDATAVLKTFDTDGFTLTWSKTSTPSGTVTLLFLCFR